MKQLQELFLPQDGILITAVQLYQYPFSLREESFTVKVKCFSNQITQMCDLIQRARVVKLPNSQISERAKGAYHSAKRSKRSFSSIWKLIHWNTNYRECFAIFPGRKKSYFFEIRLQQSLNALGKVTARYARAPCNKNVTRRTMMNGWVKVKSQMRNEDTIPDFKVHAFG